LAGGFIVIRTAEWRPLRASVAIVHERRCRWSQLKLALLASTCGLCFQPNFALATTAANVSSSTPVSTPVNIDLSGAITPDVGYVPVVTAVTPPAHGTAVIVGESVTYTPAAGFTGTDAFTYTAESDIDAVNLDPATGTVTVTVGATASTLPSTDPSVIGIVDAMQQSMLFTAQTQIDNFNRRLEELRAGSQGVSVSGLNLFGVPMSALAFSGQPGTGPRLAQQAAAGTATLSDSGSASGIGQGHLRRLAANDGSTNDGGGAAIELPDRFGVFLNGIVSVGDFNGTASQYGSGLRNVGVSGGVDYRFTKDLILGIGGGYTASSTTIGDGSKASSGGYNITLYGTDRPIDNVYIDALANLGRIDFTTNRLVAATGAIADGSPNGSQFSGSLTGGYEFALQSYTLSPYLRLSGSHTNLGAFSESGAGGSDVSYGTQIVDSLSGILGFRGDDAISTAHGIVSPHLRVEFQHEFDGGSPVGVQFANDSTGASFGTIQNHVSRNYVTLGGGVSFLTEGALAAFVDYETILGYSRLTYHTFTVGITKRF
jgi:large repetitive protein